MPDDIVTQLRNNVVEKPEFIREGSTEHLLSTAADEIERLREQNEYLKANVEMLLAEAKAVRGE